jgi:hypothetical protein
MHGGKGSLSCVALPFVISNKQPKERDTKEKKMATFIPVPETAQIRMQFTLAGQQCENVYHVRHSGGWSQENLTYIASTFQNWWTTYMKPLCPSALTLQRVIAKDVSTQDGLAVEEGIGLPTNGDRGVGAEPNSVTLSVKWGTGLAGRSYRGRTYHLQLCQDQVLASNFITQSFQEDLRAAYDALRTALDNATLAAEFVVVSKFHNNAPRTTAVTTPISGVSIEPTIDSQRRRLPGRGN